MHDHTASALCGGRIILCEDEFTILRIRPDFHFPVYPAVAAVIFLSAIAARQAAGQVFTGEVPVPAAMQAAQTPAGLEACNNHEVLDVTVCGDSLDHVVARPLAASV